MVRIGDHAFKMDWGPFLVMFERHQLWPRVRRWDFCAQWADHNERLRYVAWHGGRLRDLFRVSRLVAPYTYSTGWTARGIQCAKRSA